MTNNILRLGIQEDLFIRDLAHEFSVPGIRPLDAIEHLLSQHLATSLKSCLETLLIRPPTAHIHSMYNRDRCLTLPDLMRDGYTTWYSIIQFSTNTLEEIKDIVIEPVDIILEELSYGYGIKCAYQLKTKKLKRQFNYYLTLNNLKISKCIFQRLDATLQDNDLEQPYLANPRPGPRSGGFEFGIRGFGLVSFDHIINGSRIFCTCARNAHDKMLISAKGKAPGFVANSWPHQVIRILAHARYVDSVCHLCVARSSGSDAAAYRYGDRMREFLGVYTNQLMLCNNLDERTARAEVQELLNLSRWESEAEMYRLVKQLFPDNLVLRESSPPWLGRQRLDVFLPQLQLALEFQGTQHYEAVDIFGGTEALQRTIERDALKKRLCGENNVDLVYVRFNEPLTLASLRHRLRKHLSSTLN